jgi:molybdopterin/thiamine biosynthesis adenylyltransferase
MAMNTAADRYHRNILLFGAAGQEKLRGTRIVVAGVGGLGSPVVQHLALLGVGGIVLIEPEELDPTNRNRFIGARASDPVPGSKKTALAHRLIWEINPDVVVTTIPHGLVSPLAFTAIKEADWVFGCFDHDGPRYILNELCAAYARPYIDLASDVPEPGIYGGHVCVAHNGQGCLSCLDLLAMNEVEQFLASADDRAARAAIYGIAKEALAEKKGPSVSPLNGVIASLGVMEFMVAVTGMRPPRVLLNYYGHLGKTTDSNKPERKPDCQFCTVIRGQPDAADIERYLRMPHLRQGFEPAG